jgi:transposase
MVAAKLFELKRPTTEIAHAVSRDAQTVRRWRREWKAAGVEALKARPHPGPKPRMTAEQWHELIGLLAKPPKDYGFDAYLWTAALIGKLIEQRFKVKYHHDYVGEMLHHFNWSPQRPAKQARERDEAAIEQWRTVEWVDLLKKVAPPTR